MNTLIQKFSDVINGYISGFDRIVFKGSIMSLRLGYARNPITNIQQGTPNVQGENASRRNEPIVRIYIVRSMYLLVLLDIPCWILDIEIAIW